MLRLLFWLLLLGGLALVANGTVPAPGIADEEVVYATPPVVTTCGSSGCIVVYTLEIANVGRSVQDSVRVRLRSDALATPVIAPTVRRATDSVLATAATDRPGVDTYQLGKLGPEERVTLFFAGRSSGRDTVLGWDRVLVGVDPMLGNARPGDPSAISPTRVLHALGRVVQRIVHAVTAS